MKKEYFTDYPPFINRKKETEFLLEYLYAAPKNILFVYGPKSTGKTTLMRKVIKEELDPKKFNVKFFNLREILITNFQDFQETFFPSSLREKFTNFFLKRDISVAGFKWGKEDTLTIKANVFGAMIQKMQKMRDEGVIPVIVIDEFQYLKNIKVPGVELVKGAKNILLIEELFKFFIALTKQNNLAHVVCMTSDSYYLEELYSDTKLTNTSDFYHIKHLSYDDIKYWLTEKEDCSQEMFEKVWENLGGSVWEIWMVFVDYKNGQDWQYRIQDLIQNKFGVIMDYVFYEMKKEDKNNFIEITKALAEKGEFINSAFSVAPFHLVKKFVDMDIWFYDAKFGRVTPNSKSQQMAMKMIVEKIEEALTNNL